MHAKDKQHEIMLVQPSTAATEQFWLNQFCYVEFLANMLNL